MNDFFNFYKDNEIYINFLNFIFSLCVLFNSFRINKKLKIYKEKEFIQENLNTYLMNFQKYINYIEKYQKLNSKYAFKISSLLNEFIKLNFSTPFFEKIRNYCIYKFIERKSNKNIEFSQKDLIKILNRLKSIQKLLKEEYKYEKQN